MREARDEWKTDTGAYVGLDERDALAKLPGSVLGVFYVSGAGWAERSFARAMRAAIAGAHGWRTSALPLLVLDPRAPHAPFSEAPLPADLDLG